MPYSPVRISVIIPSRNGAKRLESCFKALLNVLGKEDEIVLVNDASTDNTIDVAGKFPCRLLNLPEGVGAARARNIGAQVAKNEILLFIDDDVLVKPETFQRLRFNFENPELSGVVGVLDDEIPFKNSASNIKNLWMRFTYLTCPQEGVGLFYTSIAAIRKNVFETVGGFDNHYSGASLEDTEFGQRVWQQGYRIRIDPQLSVTHVKHYTWSSILKTDYERARALTHMKLRKWGQEFYTSVPMTFQLAIPILFFSPVFLALCVFFKISLGWSVLPLGLFFILTNSWIRFLFRSKGWRLGIAGVLFHPIDCILVGLGMLSACWRHLKGHSY
ncbi:MAG: glycosyltransferase family 2 protein [Pseudomonadota bacterium]